MIVTIIKEDIKALIPEHEIGEYPIYPYYALISKADVEVIISLLRATGVRELFEIGTYVGVTTSILSNYVDKIYTVDLPLEMITIQTVPDIQKQEIQTKENVGLYIKDNNKVIQFYGDSGDESFMEFIRNQIGHCVDAVIVDGSHSKENVLKDSLTALSMTRENGIIIWDDVYHEPVPEVTEVLQSLPYRIIHIEGTKIGFILNNKDFVA